MPRYIDAELLDPEDFENCTPYQAREIIEDIPTADVVPKSEYEKQKLEIWRLQGEVERLKAENETLDLGLKDFRFRNKELQKANEGWAKSFEDFEIQLEEAIEFRKNQVKRIFDDIEHLCIDTFGNFNHRVFAKLKDKYI